MRTKKRFSAGKVTSPRRPLPVMLADGWASRPYRGRTK